MNQNLIYFISLLICKNKLKNIMESHYKYKKKTFSTLNFCFNCPNYHNLNQNEKKKNSIDKKIKEILNSKIFNPIISIILLKT